MSDKNKTFKASEVFLGGENEAKLDVPARPFFAMLAVGAIAFGSLCFLAGAEHKMRDIRGTMIEEAQDGIKLAITRPYSVATSHFDMGLVPELKEKYGIADGRHAITFRKNADGMYEMGQSSRQFTGAGPGGVPVPDRSLGVTVNLLEAVKIAAAFEVAHMQAQGIEAADDYFDRASAAYRENHVSRVAKEHGMFDVFNSIVFRAAQKSQSAESEAASTPVATK